MKQELWLKLVPIIEAAPRSVVVAAWDETKALGAVCFARSDHAKCVIGNDVTYPMWHVIRLVRVGDKDYSDASPHGLLDAAESPAEAKGGESAPQETLVLIGGGTVFGLANLLKAVFSYRDGSSAEFDNESGGDYSLALASLKEFA